MNDTCKRYCNALLLSACVAAPLSVRGLIDVQWMAIPAKQYAELTYLIICATFITYFLIPLAHKRIRPTLVSMYSLSSRLR